MTQVAIAASTKDFDPDHSIALVRTEPKIFAGDGQEEAGPSASRVEFRFALKEREVATAAVIDSIIGVVF